ncbi:glycine cleavage T C-terminal barrel domain-containing protein [Oceanibacterium hippocampi]|uniref:Aminomethyltransferase n=1 Tax=Oceanibacterium hippocampi TaxID=745714 RepID=A0A1Y5TCI7_9PROT|nr:glycine cleavage T C-terminal barrel domain-containing protein [Oceanibacterium hippocampi]SLN57326.1 Aminomethyltransferase [Oceanibacterium hippocampi]
MSGTRLAAPFGSLIDRTRPLHFRFGARTLSGFAGDSAASALVGAGISVLSRSFKYHRPRGLFSMTAADANSLIAAGAEPNAFAEHVPLTEGASFRGQNYAGSLERDRFALMGLFGRFLPPGFYYRAFYRPAGAWKFWEPKIRAFAGLGTVDTNGPHGYFDKAYGWCEVAVVGAGPAGLAAALAAAEDGAEVILIDRNPVIGGSMRQRRGGVGAEPLERNGKAGTIHVMTGAHCLGLYDDNWLAVGQGKRLHKIRAGRVVVATGAEEQPLVFRNNDRPGIMTADTVSRLIRLYGVLPGRRAVVVTANDQGYGVALDLVEAGAVVAAIADLRLAPDDGPFRREARAAGIELLDGWTAYEGHGRARLGVVTLAGVTGRGRVDDSRRRVDCDLLAVSVAQVPRLHLLCHRGMRPVHDGSGHSFASGELPEGVGLAGAAAGRYSLDAATRDGLAVGAAARQAVAGGAAPEPERPAPDGALFNHPWPIFPHPRGKEFVDLDEDLTIADIRNTIAEGWRHAELVKRFSTVGMGPSQGRHSALATQRLIAEATGQTLDAVGATTWRPPALPEKFGLLAGRGFEPVRRTAMHDRHVEAGAVLMPAGLWLRPAHYGGSGDAAGAIAREAANVRGNVGLIDVSTLGKLEIRGADAAAFLERVYTFAYAKQPVGKSRYVLMTDRLGIIVDDGVACRMADNHFYVTATTGGVDGVYREMLRLNAEWRMRVDIANVTAAWAAINLAGPNSRRVLERVADGLDLSPAGFPYLAVREGHVAGIPCRLLRVGFVGELGYEIHCPSGLGETLWDALVEAGREEGIAPFGVEAQRLLRLEKGHIIVGQDTDGTTNPLEADMAWAIARKKDFFVGKHAIGLRSRAGLTRKLVGFRLPAGESRVPKECHLVIRDGQVAGRVTSAARSASLGHVIGLAYVPAEHAAPGVPFDIRVDQGAMLRAEVVPLPFYDPDNERQDS